MLAGNLAPGANPEIEVTVEGPGMLIGMENGDPIDGTNYKLDHRCAFHGMALAVVQSTGGAGTVTVVAKSEGLQPDRIEL